jgi:hypothetical protein
MDKFAGIRPVPAFFFLIADELADGARGRLGREAIFAGLV